MNTYFEFSFDGENYIARCNYRNTRNGFAHDCEVMTEHYDSVTTATCHYLNRTWECFTFESVLHSAISILRERMAARAIENYKEQTGKSRIFKAQRAELEAPARVAYEKALETIKRA
jgi:hypothetical protein